MPTIDLFGCTLMPVSCETSLLTRWICRESTFVVSWKKSGRVLIAITISSSEALPARSPIPFTQTSICRAPACTAARLFATARPRSLWQCTEMRALSMFGTFFWISRSDCANSSGIA